ncbi:MAG TPA: hypothetical protein ENJ42_03100, partial [Hellea balneolensis]|nr:hypothetical protein [Hellea balneolensis]
RPKEKIYAPWIERLSAQLGGALSALDKLPQTPWLMGQTLSQVDITTAAMIGYIRLYCPALLDGDQYPNLRALAQTCEALPAFQACVPSPENISADTELATSAIKRLLWS